jgi:hypothetical protein
MAVTSIKKGKNSIILRFHHLVHGEQQQSWATEIFQAKTEPNIQKVSDQGYNT